MKRKESEEITVDDIPFVIAVLLSIKYDRYTDQNILYLLTDISLLVMITAIFDLCYSMSIDIIIPSPRASTAKRQVTPQSKYANYYQLRYPKKQTLYSGS